MFRVSDAGRLGDSVAYSAAGIRKPPRKETALGGRKAVPRALWGFGRRGRGMGLRPNQFHKLVEG